MYKNTNLKHVLSALVGDNRKTSKNDNKPQTSPVVTFDAAQ
jgi:hypothetical protein